MALTDGEVRALATAAAAVRANARAPYSGLRVGAAVLTNDGRVFAGCNVECASYGLTQCAERAAMAAAVAGGGRCVLALVLVADTEAPVTPCGACRQWLLELGGAAAEVICVGADGALARHTAGTLLPAPFGQPRRDRADGGS